MKDDMCAAAAKASIQPAALLVHMHSSYLKVRCRKNLIIPQTALKLPKARAVLGDSTCP